VEEGTETRGKGLTKLQNKAKEQPWKKDQKVEKAMKKEGQKEPLGKIERRRQNSSQGRGKGGRPEKTSFTSAIEPHLSVVQKGSTEEITRNTKSYR